MMSISNNSYSPEEEQLLEFGRNSPLSQKAGINVYEAMIELKKHHGLTLDFYYGAPSGSTQAIDEKQLLNDICTILANHKIQSQGTLYDKGPETLRWSVGSAIFAGLGAVFASGPLLAGLFLGAIGFCLYKAGQAAFEMLHANTEVQKYQDRSEGIAIIYPFNKAKTADLIDAIDEMKASKDPDNQEKIGTNSSSSTERKKMRT